MSLRLLRAAFLTVLLAMGVATSAGAQSNFEILNGIDLPGGDYLAYQQIEYGQCVQMCAGDGRCGAFTFNVEKRVCFLKQAAGQPKRFAGAVSGRKATAAAAGRYEVFRDADLPGGDIAVLRNTTLDQCEQQCTARSDCDSFTQNLSKNVCFLKAGSGQPTRFAGALSARKTGVGVAAAPVGELEQGFTMYRDADIPGGDGAIVSRESGTMEVCRLQCLFNEGCHAFTYNEKTKACFGKSRVHIGGDRMAPTPFAGATSGMKASPEQVASAKKAYFDSGPKVPQADLGWRPDDSAETFVARIRAAAKPMGGSCEVERARMRDVAKSIKATIPSASAVAGAAIPIEWSASPADNMVPLWLMVSADGPVRFNAKGFYALMPEAIAPFGMAADAARTRALTTLFGKNPLQGSVVETIPLQSGSLGLAVKAVGYLRACGEEFVADIAVWDVLVTAAPVPTFQVRDPFSFETPAAVWLSPNGKTRLEVFDGRFRLVDKVSGAYIADLEGRNPQYSPTGRFLTFNEGEFETVILDATDGQAVGNTSGVLGWENRDSFLVAGRGGGNLSINSVLVADTTIGSHSKCRICSGRSETYVLDLENDLVRVSDTSDRLSGAAPGPINLYLNGPEASVRVAADQTGAAPVYRPQRWDFRGGLAFVGYERVSDPSAPASESDAEEVKYTFVAERLDAKAPVLTSEVQPLEIGRWRGAVRVEKPERFHDGFLQRLADLNLTLSRATDPSFVVNKPAEMPIWDSVNHLRPEIAARIVASVPTAKGAFVDVRNTHHCNPYDEGPAPNGLDKVFSVFDRAMEFRIGERSIWLTMYSCVQGSAAFYYPNFHFFDSAYDQGFLRIDGANAAESRGSACAQDISHCNFDARLYADRYLLIWSTESRALMLFDIDERRVVYKEFNLGRGDLFKEAFYSVEDQHIVQVNSDGSFYVYDVTGQKRVMEGRYVDDEVIGWTPDLRFDASPEGANYVSLRFPGQSGQYSFQQYARAVKRPGLFGEVLKRNYVPAEQQLGIPPTLSGEIGAVGDRVAGTVNAERAVRVDVYQDGLLTGSVDVKTAAVDINVAKAKGARWVSLVAVDATGLSSLPVGKDIAVGSVVMPVVHALAVGVDKYDSLAALKYAAADAGTLTEALQTQHGKSLTLASSDTLIDEGAAAETILAKAEQMVKKAAPGETIVFTFAGHGVTGPDDRFYLATSATDAANVTETALAWDMLAAVLARSKARVLVFLDACHSGAAGTTLFATNDDAAGDVLSRVPAGLLVFSASKGRQFSEESAAVGGGFFTNAVADVIARDRGAFDLDGNGAIEISELYAGVKLKVSRLSQGRQVPWLARNQLVGDFAIF